MDKRNISAIAWAISSCLFLWLFSLAQGKEFSDPPTHAELFESFVMFSFMLLGGGACYHFLTEIICSPYDSNSSHLWGNLCNKMIMLMLVLLSIPLVILISRCYLELHIAKIISLLYLFSGMAGSFLLGIKIEPLFKKIRLGVSNDKISSRQTGVKPKREIMNVTLNISGFILLIASIFVFGLKGMTSEMGIAVAASCIFLAFANLDKFSEFKGAGFQAKLRQAVDEANATIENLKEVAKPLIKNNLFILAKAGRFSSGAFNKNHEVFDQLIELQEKMDLGGEDLENAKTQYLNIHAWDMISELSGNLERAGNDRFSVNSREVLGTHNFSSPPDLKKFKLLLNGLELNETTKQQLEVIEEYYIKYKL